MESSFPTHATFGSQTSHPLTHVSSEARSAPANLVNLWIAKSDSRCHETTARAARLEQGIPVTLG